MCNAFLPPVETMSTATALVAAALFCIIDKVFLSSAEAEVSDTTIAEPVVSASASRRNTLVVSCSPSMTTACSSISFASMWSAGSAASVSCDALIVCANTFAHLCEVLPRL